MVCLWAFPTETAETEPHGVAEVITAEEDLSAEGREQPDGTQEKRLRMRQRHRGCVQISMSLAIMMATCCGVLAAGDASFPANTLAVLPSSVAGGIATIFGEEDEPTPRDDGGARFESWTLDKMVLTNRVYTERDYQADWSKWLSNRWVNAYATHGLHSNAWDEAVNEMIRQYVFLRTSKDTNALGRIIALGEGLAAQQCPEPIVLVILGTCLYAAGRH
jgi:hypothetical protein